MNPQGHFGQVLHHPHSPQLKIAARFSRPFSTQYLCLELVRHLGLKDKQHTDNTQILPLHHGKQHYSPGCSMLSQNPHLGESSSPKLHPGKTEVILQTSLLCDVPGPNTEGICPQIKWFHSLDVFGSSKQGF